MTTKLAKWASEHDQIIKSRLSYGHQAKSLPSEAGLAYDWLRFKGYLGNVGLISPLLDVSLFCHCIRGGDAHDCRRGAVQPFTRKKNIY